MTLRDDIRNLQRRLGLAPDGIFGPLTLAAIRRALDECDVHKAPVQIPEAEYKGGITPRIALELIDHEAIVQEAYLDSVNVWTWGVGVTDASGHFVGRYKDKPVPIRRCLEIYIWLLQTKYMPTVVEEFEGHQLTEAQFAAALSFHYNTGAIIRANWADLWKAGKVEEAKEAFMNWKTPASIIERRKKERDLFFDGVWSQDGKAVVFPVSKPSYRPNFSAGKHVDVRADIEALLA